MCWNLTKLNLWHQPISLLLPSLLQKFIAYNLTFSGINCFSFIKSLNLDFVGNSTNSPTLWLSFLVIHLSALVHITNMVRVQFVFIWNLGTHDFRHDFTIFFIYMKSYLNSQVMKCSIWIYGHEIFCEFMIWIHIWTHDLNSWRICEIICKNAYLWIHPWTHAVEFMIMKSYMNSCHEFICEFRAMKNIVKSWLNFYKGIHLWNHGWIH